MHMLAQRLLDRGQDAARRLVLAQIDE